MTVVTSAKDWQDLEGWWDERDAQVAKLVAQWLPDGAVCVEVGTWLGRSMACLLQAVQWHGKTITEYAIDSWIGSVREEWQVQFVLEHGGGNAMLNQFEKNMRDCGVYSMVTPIQISSVDGSTRFADGALDFVFLDGDHTEEAVFADITAWLPKVKSRGIIAGHDVRWSGVKPAADEFFGPGRYTIMDNCWLYFTP